MNSNSPNINSNIINLTKNDLNIKLQSECKNNLDYHKYLFFIIMIREGNTQISEILSYIKYDKNILYEGEDSRDVIRRFLMSDKASTDRSDPWINFVMSSEEPNAKLIKYLLVSTNKKFSLNVVMCIDECFKYGVLDLEKAEYEKMIIHGNNFEVIPIFNKYQYTLNLTIIDNASYINLKNTMQFLYDLINKNDNVNKLTSLNFSK